MLVIDGSLTAPETGTIDADVAAGEGCCAAPEALLLTPAVTAVGAASVEAV